MTNPPRVGLSPELSDLEWFTTFCGLLTRVKKPTLGYALQLLGTPKEDPPRERRGSLFLAPFDRRFAYVSVNPDVAGNPPDLPLEHVGVSGPQFSLRIADILRDFPEHRLKYNTWDGGNQIYFYPVPKEYEFTALDSHIDLDDVPDPRELMVNNISFHFGDRLVEYRDGFAMRR
jgi:hypothetical protein